MGLTLARQVCLSGVPACADITNVAQVTYLNAAGTLSTGISNTVTVAVAASGSTSLPAINPSDLPSTAELNDSLNITNYPDSNVGFVWNFAPGSGDAASSARSAGASLQPLAAGTANFTSGFKTNSLASYGLGAGSYQVSVYAQDPATGAVSPTLTVTMTLLAGNFMNVRVYPNPWRSDKHAGSPITFDQLPANCSIRIFTISGHKAKEFDNVTGSVTWDLTNENGDQVASGIYIYLITDSQGDKARGKVAVIK